MIQTKNYCTHAIEQFGRYRYSLDHIALAAAGATNMKDSPAIDKGIDLLAHDCAELLHHAEKFVMPDWGRIFEKTELEIFEGTEVPNRLPYPVIACEFFCDYAKHMNLGPHEMPSSKRIALLVERDAIVSLAPFINEVLMPEGEEQGYMVMPVCFFDAVGIWTPPPSIGWMSRDARPQDFKANAIITPLGMSSYSIYPENERFIRAVKDFSDEVITAIHLILALSMERTDVTVLPAPEKLNQKRARSKKPPLYEYKVLDIVADIMEAPKTSTARPHGHHASPRLHKRRGHVRRLASGRVTWIRNTIVGKPGRGEIRKDYTVHK